MDQKLAVEHLMAADPRVWMFIMADESDAPIGDVTVFVMRLLRANGGWLEPNEARASRFLGKGKAEARSVGADLDRLFGYPGMAAVHDVIDELLPDGAARELEAAWDGIGDWHS